MHRWYVYVWSMLLEQCRQLCSMRLGCMQSLLQGSTLTLTLRYHSHALRVLLPDSL
jgi:hypothetical protein